MDNVLSVFRTNEILLNENEGLDGSTLIPIELGGKLPSLHQVNNKARIVSIMDLGKMLLHCAREGETHKVHELMSRGAPFTTDWLGTTPLHVAAEKNHYSTCEVLLRAGISKDARTKVDRTPLHFAVFEGHEQIVQLLLKHSCDVNAKDMLKMTPLHWAVQKGYKNIAKLLLQNGADPSALSKFLKTPITLAVESDQNDLVQELMIQNLQRSDFEQQQAAATLVHELNVRLKPDPELIIEDVMDIDEITNANELDVIDSSQESNPAFTEDFESFSSQSNHQGTVEAHNKSSNKEANSANASTLALLKEHGIAMQEDTDNTLITSALQSGRQLVLSDAGKLLLNDPKFKKCLPTIGKRSTTSLHSTSTSTTATTVTTMPKTGTGTSTIKFENVKKKPTILTPSKTMPLETNKVIKILSAEEFKLMVGNNGGNLKSSKTPNGFIRYQAIKNSNVMTQLVKRKNPIENIPSSKIKIGPLTGTLKTPIKPDNSKPRISNFQSISATATSTIPKEANSDILSRVAFNIIGNPSASTNLPQATTISTGQPYTVKLVSVPQTTTTTSSKPKSQIVQQLHHSIVQSRQQQPQSTSNGTQMSEIEKKVVELQKLTDELRKQNEEYKFRLEKLENEKEWEREERLSRQYTNS